MKTPLNIGLLITFFLLGSFAPGFSPLASAQEGGVSQIEEDADSEVSKIKKRSRKKLRKGKRRGKKHKKRKSRRGRKGRASAKAAAKDAAAQKLGETVGDKVKQALFPDWSTPGFDWGLDPIIGFVYKNHRNESGQTTTVQTEMGLAAKVSGIPVAVGNPGLYISPRVGKAWGQIEQSIVSSTGDRSSLSGGYERSFGGISFILPIKFYKHVLEISLGLKAFNGDYKSSLLRSQQIYNDSGVLIFNWVSMHYTNTILKAYYDSFEETPFLTQMDHWLHLRVFTNVLAFQFDIGPGMTTVEEIVSADTYKGETQYFKATSSAYLFWKLGMTAQAKYVFASSEEMVGNFADVALPDQGIYDAPSTASPEDSLYASAFFGIPNLVAGFGVGWQYNVRAYNYLEKDGKKRDITEDNGLKFSYQVSF